MSVRLAIVLAIVALSTLNVPGQAVKVKLIITVKDACTEEPLETTVHVFAVTSDERYKELIWKDSKELLIGSYALRNGRVEVEVPFHNRYIVSVEPVVRPVVSDTLAVYEPVTVSVRFNGSPLRVDLKVWPVGNILAEVYNPDGSRVSLSSWKELRSFNGGMFYGISYSGVVCGPYITRMGRLSILVPAHTPSMVVWAAEVPGYGWAVLTADNDGKGYVLFKGIGLRLNLVYETAKTMLRLVRTQINSLNLSELPRSVRLRLEKAEKALNNASLNRFDWGLAAKYSWDAISNALLAREEALLAASWRALASYRMGILRVEVTNVLGQPVEGVNLTLRPEKLNFALTVERDESDGNWMRLYAIARWLTIPSFSRDVDRTGRLDVEKVLRILEVEMAGGLKAERMIASTGLMAPALHVDALLGGAENYYSSGYLDAIYEGRGEEAFTSYLSEYVTITRRYGPRLYSLFDSLAGWSYILRYRSNNITWYDYAPMALKALWAARASALIRDLSPDTPVYLNLGSLTEPYVTALWARQDYGREAYWTPLSPEAIDYFRSFGADFDGISVKIRGGEEWGVWDLWTVHEALTNLSRLVKGIWISELSYPSAGSEIHTRPWRGAFNEDRQAEFLTKLLVVLMANPKVVGMNLERWRDGTLWSGCGPVVFTGLCTADGAPKKAFYALLDLLKNLTHPGPITPGKPVRILGGVYRVCVYLNGELRFSALVPVKEGSETLLRVVVPQQS